jgi:hypothetical protein
MRTLFAGLLLLTCGGAQALGTLAEVRVVDRASGASLPTYYHRGEYWVAGSPGAKYAIEIRNRSGERVLAVAAVDGVNVVSGETAAWNQTGYVFTPGERYQITGWRKSDAEVAGFAFTALPNSYAARTGRPANVGVIGVALFRERAPEPPPEYSRAPDADFIGGASREAAAAAGTANRALPSVVPAPLPAAKLGTAHGEREYSSVSHTEFERLTERPNELVKIRYDSWENLVALGVVPRRPPAAPMPMPFPGSREEGYVPDPPG